MGITDDRGGTNLQLVQRAFEAFAGRDHAALIEIMDPEVEFFAPTAAIANEGRCYRGHEGIARYLYDVDATWTRLVALPEKFRDVGNHVVAVGRVDAQARDGFEFTAPAAWVWQVKSGKLVWGCVYADPGTSFMGLTVEVSKPVPDSVEGTPELPGRQPAQPV